MAEVHLFDSYDALNEVMWQSKWVVLVKQSINEWSGEFYCHILKNTIGGIWKSIGYGSQ